MKVKVKVKALIIIMCLFFSTAGFSHSGGLDKKGGHNCSEKSKRKGLCSGYHYHRAAEAAVAGILDQTKSAARVASKG